MQLVPIDKLIPYVNNARTHSPEQLNKLRSSLREFGFINPVIIDRDFNVIAGHGRILAAKAENISEVPCVFVDYLTPAQKKAYIIADKKTVDEIAVEVIAGLWGNGSERKKKLTEAGYDYSEVQRRVNLLIK